MTEGVHHAHVDGDAEALAVGVLESAVRLAEARCAGGGGAALVPALRKFALRLGDAAASPRPRTAAAARAARASAKKKQAYPKKSLACCSWAEASTTRFFASRSSQPAAWSCAARSW